MDNAHPLSSPMVVQSVDPKKNPFHREENVGKILGPYVLYLNVIGTLLYLAQHFRLCIAFFVNLLARFSLMPT